MDYTGMLINAIFIEWPLGAIVPLTIFRSFVGK